MISSAIRELSASKATSSIAAAHFEGAVQIWDVSSQRQICDLNTPFCAGARNLAISPDARLLVVGLSKQRGKVAAYEIPSGSKLWEISVKYPSFLRFDRSGQALFCTENRKSVLVIEASTGANLRSLDHAVKCMEGPGTDALIVPSQAGRPYSLIPGRNAFSLERSSFAVLDAQFSPESACVAEASGPVRFISRDTGKVQRAFDLRPNAHITRLHHSANLHAFFGIVHPLKKGVPRELVRFDVERGNIERICALSSWEEVFLETMDNLVTSMGEIIELTNGDVTGRLAFPQREYPDF